MQLPSNEKYFSIITNQGSITKQESQYRTASILKNIPLFLILFSGFTAISFKTLLLSHLTYNNVFKFLIYSNAYFL